ncbi:MAG: hypothetical protein EZS28_036762 [Streblomastix strix]|uniref:DDE-1 domain-containing protein n=1 Tax=Streblomastix strix TaxID=222440 RepID=A0A5J4UCT0_9EUKA|nr:MAG: hypothetical protein EZS28_036762 [Streblomastix strix]
MLTANLLRYSQTRTRLAFMLIVTAEIVPKQFEHASIHFPIERTEPRVSARVEVCMSGEYLRPFLITKEDFSLDGMLNNILCKTRMLLSCKVKLSTHAEIVIMVDNATQHCTIAIKELLKENNIILLSILPNFTHLLQPCDVDIFGSLKLAYQQGHHGIATITTEQIFSHIVDATQKAATLLSIANSFKVRCLGIRISKGNLVVKAERNIFNEKLKQIRSDNSAVSDRILLPGQLTRKVKFGALNS